MVDRAGQQFAGYHLINRLGGGNFGDVYLGKHINKGTSVAVKILQARLIHAEDVKAFINEVRVLFQLQHPHIVPLLDFGIEDDSPFLVMAYAPNKTLRQPKYTRLPPDQVVNYVNQIAEALQFAHEHMLIHRDVKPDNLLLGPNNQVWLSDFGITCVAQSSKSLDTQEKVGTIPYMAPEQLLGKPRPASDQYALGIIIYEWLCGTRPFTGTELEIVTQHLHASPSPLHEIMPEISPLIEEVVLKALSKDPFERFTSVQAFARALEQANLPFPQIHENRQPEVSLESVEIQGESISLSLHPQQDDDKHDLIGNKIVPDVPEILLDSHKIEDVEEPDGSQDFPVHHWDNEFLNEPDESFSAPGNDARARGGSRSGKLQRRPDKAVEDYLPPADQSILIRPNPNRSASSSSAGIPRVGGRGAQVPLPLPAGSQRPVRNMTTRPVDRTQQQSAQSRPVTRSRIPAALPPPPSRRRSNQTSRRRGRATTIIVVVVLVLLLLVGVGFFYYGTTATVTITVPSKSLSLTSFKLIASTNTQSKFPNSVASQLLTHDASMSGTGTATGSIQQGNAKATGLVNFTNIGQQNVTIPADTVLTTGAGTGAIQFVTTASAIVPSGNSTVPMPVQAQNAGNSGNVGPNTITIVSDTSITLIAQASNLSTSQISLKVTNPSALTDGGATQVPAATQNDLQALKNSLHQQLQTQVKTWLQSQVHQGDITGTLSPDILGNSQTLPQEQLADVPTIGSPLSSKTFPGTLSVKVTVLVVRHSSLIAAAESQLNAAALAIRPNPYVLSTQIPITLSGVSSFSSSDGTTITITLSASGLVMLRVDTQAVSLFLTGKTKDQAIIAISVGDAGPRGVENVHIDISPSFLIIMPFRSEHIHINVMPGIALPKG